MVKVWCNGVFDMGLHEGHLALFKYAHSLGDSLVVGIDCDLRVYLKKGVDRPVFNEKKRAKSILDTGLVWDVKIFKSDRELSRMIKEYAPDIFVIGSDYKGKKIIGSQFAKEIVYFERLPNISTTEILNKK